MLVSGCGQSPQAETQHLAETVIFATLVTHPTTAPTATPRDHPTFAAKTTAPHSQSPTASLAPTQPKPTPTPFIIRVTVYKLNVRSGPGTTYDRVSQVQQGSLLQAFGRNPTGDWIRVRLPQGEIGWVAAQFTDIGNRIQLLPAVSSD